MHPQPFHEFLVERLKERNPDLKHLSELTGIPLQHLEHLERGEYNRLPAAPYVRGYLGKLGTALNFDPDFWWNEIKLEGAVHQSGAADRLPDNRFLRRQRRGWIGLVVLVIFLVAYGAFRFSQISGKPNLLVSEPQETLARTDRELFVARGVLEEGTLSLSGEVIPRGEGGAWEKEIMLQPGLNTIRFQAKKFLGKEVVVIRQILYEPTTPEILPSTSSPSEI